MKNEIKKIKNICDKFIENIEIYYTICSDIINNYNYNNKNRNYQILKNINDINDKIIINDINNIISLKDKSLKFSKINEIYNKMRIRFIKNEKESKNNFKKIDKRNPKNNKKTHKRNNTVNRNNINGDNDDNYNYMKTYNNGFYFGKFGERIESKRNLNQNNKEKRIGINNIKGIKRIIDEDTFKEYDDIKNKTEENFIERINRNPLKSDKSVPIFKPIKDANEISIIYKIEQNDKNKGVVKIFGKKFVMNNEKKCYIINNINYDLTEYFNIKDIKENTFEIKLIDIKNITNISNMFNECSSLISIKDISNWNTSNIEDMSYLFNRCSSLSKFSGISEWDTKNVINMSYLFSFCARLEKLPDISKWDTSSVIAMSNLFNGCSSLKELPDISKWNTNNVKDMGGLFNNCSSLEK